MGQRSTNLLGGAIGAGVLGLAFVVGVAVYLSSPNNDDRGPFGLTTAWGLVGACFVLPVVLLYGALAGSYLARVVARMRASRRPKG